MGGVPHVQGTREYLCCERGKFQLQVSVEKFVLNPGEVVVVRGVNHLLVPAITGEISEYASLPDRNVSKNVSGTLTAWLTKTFAAIK